MKHSYLVSKPGRVAFSLLAVAAAASAPLLLAGCGSGSHTGAVTPAVTGTAATRHTGALTINIKWPDRSRLIPDAANSIVLTLTKGGAVFAKLPLTRPAAGQPLTTSTTFNDLPVGTGYLITASAFPVADGSGVAQASGSTSVPVTIVDGQTTVVPTIVMGSTIVSIQLVPDATFPLGVGATRTLTAMAFDASGNVVITSLRKFTFVSSDTSGLTTLTNVAGAAVPTATLVANSSPAAPVSVTVTGTDAESGKSGTAVIVIDPTGVDTTALWAKIHADGRNTGVAPAATTSLATGVANPLFMTTGTIVFASPAVGADGTVYSGSYDGNIYAINPDGTPKWTVNTGDIIESSPVIGKDGAVYIGSNDGKLYCIDTATGKTRYAFAATDGPVFGAPALGDDGTVYFGTTGTGKTLYAINGLSGTLKWSVPVGAGIQTAPAVSGTGAAAVVYVGSTDTNVYAFAGATGKPAAAPFALDDTIYSSSCVISNDGTVYVGTLGGKLYALTPALTQKWVFNAGAQIYSTPALSPDNNTVYVATFDNQTGVNQSKLFAVNAADGTPVANRAPFLFGDGVTGSPAVGGDGTVYIGSLDGNLYAINADGSQKWAASVRFTPTDTNAIESSPALLRDGTLYVGATDGYLYNIVAATGGKAATAPSHMPTYRRGGLHTSSWTRALQFGTTHRTR